MFNIPTTKKTDISCIPPEILREIFTHCSPKKSLLQGTQPLPLSSVSRLWRTLASATPVLWASLNIVGDDDDLRPPLPVIRTHLQRSKTHPLSIILRADGGNVLTVLTVLAAARQQWCDVDVKLYKMTPDILDLIMSGDAPLLQSMQCSVGEFHQRPIPLDMLHRCPRLESFQWNDFGAPLLLPLGDTCLTSLSLHTFLSVSECTTLLRLSPRLSSAEFVLVDYSDFSPVSHLTHPALRSLTAAGEHSDTLLATLTLPALQDLDLTAEAVDLPIEWDTILSAFLERSRPTLHQLTLSMTDVQSREPALLRILARTPHLRMLSLSDCRGQSPPLTAAIIHALHPSTTPLCPRLERLYLYGISDCPDGLCGAMLRARWGAQAHANGVACLEWGHIQVKGDVHGRDESDVEELHAMGMRMMFFAH